MTRNAISTSALVLFVLLTVGIGKSFARQVGEVRQPITQHLNQSGGNPEPPPPCCNLVAVH